MFTTQLLALHFPLALILFFLTFYCLGFTIIRNRRKELAGQEIISLSFCLGVVLFVLLAVLMGILHLRFMMLPLMIVVSSLSVAVFRRQLLSPWKIFLTNKMLSLLIFLGILVQGFINFPSGFLYKEGLYFWSSQGHDGIWHVALMEEIKKNFPPQNPVFAGEKLYNYHYLVDALMGEFSRIYPFFHPLDLYFRFFPILFSFLIGITIFSFAKRWRGETNLALLAVFFTYFTGSFGYIVTYLKHGNILGGETVFWAAQLNTIVGNPPHAISISLLSAFFLSFMIYISSRNLFWLTITFILGSTLAGFKVSGGLVLLIGVGATAMMDFLLSRKISVMALAILLGASNFLTFNLMTYGAASFLMFLPWWFIRTMIVAGDRLDWVDLENKRQHYLAQGTWHANLRVIQLEVEAFLIFLVGNLGMRIIGFLEISKKVLKISSSIKSMRLFAQQGIFQIETLLLVTMLAGFVIPMLFVQKGIIYNNIQFLQYFLLIFGFYAAASLYYVVDGLRQRKIARFIVLTGVVILSVPTVVGNLREFYGPGTTPLAKITNAQLEALSFLKNHSSENQVVLTLPFDKYLKDRYKTQPKPIFAWYSTAYIPALASRRTYLSSEEQVLITGYPLNNRLIKAGRFFNQDDYSWNRKFLSEEKIDYIYLSKDETKKPIDISRNGLKIIFENQEVTIFKVEKYFQDVT